MGALVKTKHEAVDELIDVSINHFKVGDRLVIEKVDKNPFDNSEFDGLHFFGEVQETRVHEESGEKEFCSDGSERVDTPLYTEHCVLDGGFVVELDASRSIAAKEATLDVIGKSLVHGLGKVHALNKHNAEDIGAYVLVEVVKGYKVEIVADTEPNTSKEE